jgi:23S rRNA (guanosine2251-2'-O)-methyltransferase
MNKLKPNILRHEKPTEEELKKVKHNPIYLVLDNVIDTYNIGSLFRLADAIGVIELFICGDSEYPPSSRIHKAAVGTENWVNWKKYASVSEALVELKTQGVQIIAVEQDKRSVNYKNLNKLVKFPVAIIVGHETNGVSKVALDAADLIVELPMMGINNSFNVWGSAAVIAYKILENIT